MFEAYSVAIRVSLINGVTSGLMNISRAFMQAHGNAAKLQRQLDAIKFKLVAGAALTGTGIFGLSLIEKTVPAAREYAHQIQQMNVAGMRQIEIAKAVKEAWGAAGEAPTASATENLKAIRELRMVFGDTGHAIANLVTVQKLQAILQNTADGHGGRMSGDQAYTVAKALEMKGAVRSPAEFNLQADMMANAIVASGGKVNPNDFLSTFKYGRSATIGWGDHFTYEILPTLIQEMKSSGGTGGAGGPGNALMSVYDKVINGRIAQKDLGLWSQLGLLDASKIVYTKTHSAKGVLPGAVAGWELFQRDPYTWTQQVLMPALRAHGITDPAQQQMYLSRLGGTRTAAFMLQQMGLQGWKFDRDVPLIRGAAGISAYSKLLKNDPFMAQKALEEQWTNVKTRLGLVVLPMLITGTIRLTKALTDVSDWMGAHPNLTKGLVLGFTALSAAMAFGGAVILLSAAFSAVNLAVPVLTGLLPLLGAGLIALQAPIVAAQTAAVQCAAGVATVGSSLVALAGIITFTVGPALAAVVGAAMIVKGYKYSNLIKHPGQASTADLLGALQYAKDQEKSYRDQIRDHHILPKTGQGFVQKWQQDQATISRELQRRGAAPGGKPAPASWSPAIAPPQALRTSSKGDVFIDGQKAGQVIWRHHADDLDRVAAASGGSFDGRMALAPVGMNA